MMPRNTHSNPLVKLALVVVCLLPLLASLGPGLSMVAQAQPTLAAAAYSVYLPLLRGQSGQPTTPPPPPPTESGSAIFMQAQQGKKIAGAQIKVDAQGGIHLAYYDAVPLAQKPGATYAYCPPPSGQCGDPAKWSYTPAMGDSVDEVQLQLTPAGHPRLLIGYHATQHNRELYIYGECNSNCTAAEESWTFVVAGQRSLGVVSPGSSTQPKRSFALDAQGRPGFVIYDDDYIAEPDHAGGYYISCQQQCTEQVNWIEARFTYRDRGYNELINQPVLQYAPDGKPVILAELYPLSGTGEAGIYYFRCDKDCNQTGPWNWSRARIAERFSGPQPSWDLELDGQGRPRVAYFKYLSNQDATRALFYLWCDATCTSSASWRSTSVGVPQNEGIGADLELDSTGRPRIAFLTTMDLGYAWCNGNCTTVQGWQHGYADSDQQMTKDYPVPLPTTCKAGVWDGYAPALALDAGGNPRMAYNASYWANCQYQDPSNPNNPPRDEYIELWHSVRAVFVPQP